MAETVSSLLTPWSNFYIMAGSSAAALTGLMFVVITLVAGRDPDALVGLVGLLGVAYLVRLALLTRRLTQYTPDLSDWAWYTVLPFIAYGALLLGAISLAVNPAGSLFAIAGGVLLLIFIGIRNAWDVVTFLATGGADQEPK
jgi:hypothetical protein